jgi:lipopolysaccharide/colanic/teichoic acid biosynthesis glycosyltransferase
MTQLGTECVKESLESSWEAGAVGLHVKPIALNSDVPSIVRSNLAVSNGDFAHVRIDSALADDSSLRGPYAIEAAISPCPTWKRAIDIAGASLGLMVLSPLLLIVAAYIKCVSRGPVFFRQRRYGAGGRPFVLWKLRTMHVAAAAERHRSHVSGLMESNGRLAKCDAQFAIIPGGRFLRKLGVDELPQLFNVLKGEMSLVGPRPDVLPIGNYRLWQRRRFDVVPGITGLWQVCGKNDTTFSTMIRLDIVYVRRRSLWLDLLILLRTIPAVARN